MQPSLCKENSTKAVTTSHVSDSYEWKMVVDLENTKRHS